MKKPIVLIVVLAFLVTTALAGCAQSQPPANSTQSDQGSSSSDVVKKKIGVAMYDLTNPFYVDMMTAGNDAAADYNVDVIWKSSEGSLDKEITLVENFIEQKVDCILIDPIDAQGIVPVINKAGEAGIPVVTMGNFVDTPYNVCTLYNDYNDTKRIAEIIGNLIDKTGKVGLIFGSSGNFCSDERQRGFADGLGEFPDITLVQAPSNFDAATGLKSAQDMLAANPDIKAMHVVSDGVTLSVMQATKGTDIVLTSYDGNKEASAFVKTGEITLDLLTGAKRVGYWNVKVGAQLANGEKLDQKQYLSSYFVMNDDLKAKVESWGLADGIKIVNPDDAIRLFDDYRSDLGPNAQ